MQLRVAMEIASTEAEGPGRRYAIWVQGCPMRCPGCCNPSYLPFEGGEGVDLEALSRRVLETPGIEGISLLGGEPTEQAEALAELAVRCQARGLTVMVYSGYTMKELRLRENPHVTRLLAHTDLLVDGRYNQNQPDSTRRWVGSRNQGMHFLSTRYSPEDSRFREKETVEFRLTKGSTRLTINGWPTKELLEQ